jgi:hypothetical protein
MKTLPKSPVLFLEQSVFSRAKARMVTYSGSVLFSSYSANIPASESGLEIAFTILESSTVPVKFENNFAYKIANNNRRVLQRRKIFTLTKLINSNNCPNGIDLIQKKWLSKTGRKKYKTVR